MPEKTVKVPNISCGHCVMTIEREVRDVAGVTSVKADAGAKTVSVEWGAPATWEAIRALLEEIRYPPQEP